MEVLMKSQKEMIMSKEKIRSTTVIAVRKDGKVAMAGDGQVTICNTVMKGNARKFLPFATVVNAFRFCYNDKNKEVEICIQESMWRSPICAICAALFATDTAGQPGV